MSASKVRWPELSQLSSCSEFDKENLMEFSLNSLLLIYFTTVAMHLLSQGHTVTVTWPPVTSITPLWYCDKVTWYFSVLYLVVISPIRKEKKRNINNNLAVLPSHDKEPLDSYLYLHCLWNRKCESIESKKTRTSEVSWTEHRIYLELDLGRRRRCNLGRLWKEQQARKAWLGAHLDCITPIRFGVGGTDKGATKCRGSMSDQLTVFSRGAFVTVCKGWHLREAMWQRSRKILQSFLQPSTYILLELHIILISLIIYKPLNFDNLPLDL